MSSERVFVLTWLPDPKSEWGWLWDDKERNKFVSATQNGTPVDYEWSTGNTRRILPGDRFYLYRQHKDHGIIGSGTFTTKPYRGKRGERRLLAGITFEHLVSVEDRLPREMFVDKCKEFDFNTLYSSGQEIKKRSDIKLIDRHWKSQLARLGRIVVSTQGSVNDRASRTWRMAFRLGDNGDFFTQDCISRNIAAITYLPVQNTDLIRHTPGNSPSLWKQLSSSGSSSLKCLAYVMKRGDTIVVKEGPQIVHKGKLLSGYQFDDSSKGLIKSADGSIFRHYVKVKWDDTFVPVNVQVGDQQRFTIRELTDVDVHKIESFQRNANSVITKEYALEGARLQKMIHFQQRNRTLIEQKKRICGCRCEVCEMVFEEYYGSCGKGYIVAHHNDPIGKRTSASKTTLDDIALVCPNCHAMIHKKDPPYTVSELRQVVQRHKSNGE